MAKKALYLLFDQLPDKANGGLGAVHAGFAEEFSDAYDIKLVSVFGGPPTDIPAFQGLEVIRLTSVPIDIRFPLIVRYLREGRFAKVLGAIASGLFFFLFIPWGRLRTRKLLEGKAVIASSPAAALFLSRRVRYILEVHSSFGYFWGEDAPGRLQVALMPGPALTVFHTEADAAKGQSLFPSDWVHNCFDDRLLGQGEDARKRERRSPSALFVGRLNALKNPLMLLRCAELVRQEVPRFTLDIYGDGELREELEAQIRRRGLEDVVSLKGFTEDKGVYAGYDLLWLTSTSEGFGLVLVEAMANGTPCITTRWGDAACEVVRDGETGYVCEGDEAFAAASVRILADEAERDRLSANARLDYEERFTPKRHRQAWERLLERF